MIPTMSFHFFRRLSIYKRHPHAGTYLVLKKVTQPTLSVHLLKCNHEIMLFADNIRRCFFSDTCQIISGDIAPEMDDL